MPVRETDPEHGPARSGDALSALRAEIARLYQQPEKSWKAAILNVARTGWFSSDRTINEFARDIWGIQPHPENP